MPENAVVFQDKRMRKYINGILYRSKDPQKKNDYVVAVSAKVYDNIMDHFNKETGPKGSWKKWSKSYSEFMTRIGQGGNKKLQGINGRLRQSFQPQNVKETSDGLMWYNPAKVKGFPYAKAHDEGGPRLPQRKFMFLSRKGMKMIEDITLKFVKGWKQ